MALYQSYDRNWRLSYAKDHGRDYATLTDPQRKSIIRSQMNVTQKYAPSSDGNGRIKDKLKARLVGGGDG